MKVDCVPGKAGKVAASQNDFHCGWKSWPAFERTIMPLGLAGGPFAVIGDVNPTDIHTADGIECGLAWDEVWDKRATGACIIARTSTPVATPETVRTWTSTVLGPMGPICYALYRRSVCRVRASIAAMSIPRTDNNLPSAPSPIEIDCVWMRPPTATWLLLSPTGFSTNAITELNLAPALPSLVPS